MGIAFSDLALYDIEEHRIGLVVNVLIQRQCFISFYMLIVTLKQEIN